MPEQQEAPMTTPLDRITDRVMNLHLKMIRLHGFAQGVDTHARIVEGIEQTERALNDLRISLLGITSKAE